MRILYSLAFRAVSIFVIALFLPSICFAQTPQASGGAPLQQFDQIMLSLLQNYNVPGGALAICKDGKLVFARGYGFAELENRRPFEPTTYMSLASVTKAVTGVAALRLVDEGKLNLDDTLYNDGESAFSRLR